MDDYTYYWNELTEHYSKQNLDGKISEEEMEYIFDEISDMTTNQRIQRYEELGLYETGIHV